MNRSKMVAPQVHECAVRLVQEHLQKYLSLCAAVESMQMKQFAPSSYRRHVASAQRHASRVTAGG
jgi:hypothetical protein